MGKTIQLPPGGKQEPTQPSPRNPGSDRSSVPWFPLTIAVLIAVGVAMVLVLAQQRESVAGIAPEAGEDHWHSSFSVYACDQWLPPTSTTEHGNGIHSHADGLIHIHPSNPQAAGPNATLGEYLSASGALLTDDSYVPGPGEAPTILDEATGCDGAPAELVVARWAAEDPDAGPEVFRSDLAEYRFRTDGEIFTLALLPEGQPVPRDPSTDPVASPAGPAGLSE